MSSWWTFSKAPYQTADDILGMVLAVQASEFEQRGLIPDVVIIFAHTLDGVKTTLVYTCDDAVYEDVDEDVMAEEEPKLSLWRRLCQLFDHGLAGEHSLPGF